MNTYDVFEVLPNRSVMWHACVPEAQAALAKLEAIAKLTANECFAINLLTQEIVGPSQLMDSVREILVPRPGSPQVEMIRLVSPCAY